ncbi:MAG: metallophosphoesterase [Verrucomicrobia bacterium]|nr:metallophosphoesterase [Verrucomicrobiota bacterium]
MKLIKISRRRLFYALLCGTPVLAVADALWFEPNWFKVRRLRLTKEKPTVRFVHFTDLHHKGDRDYLTAVVKKINALAPEFVCFTGDLVEDAEFVNEALELLRGIKAPLYGVPGNHDYWSKADFKLIAAAFAATGGKWLMDESISAAGGRVNLAGATCMKAPQLTLNPAAKNIVLIHYPEWVDKIGAYKFDLALAGHSHGGQVRIPFYGPLVTPWGVGRYDLGLFHTASGPLYVGAGLGWFYMNVRFNCRPEITVIEI